MTVFEKELKLILKDWMIPPNSDATVGKNQPEILDQAPPDDKVIGFVTSGGFSFTEGLSTCIASVVASSISRLLGKSKTAGKTLVLVKGVHD
ncbi:hypothetical protein HK096_001019, partial [Nowakowskiella sp. JEL0078]